MEGDVEWLQQEWDIALQTASTMSKRLKEDVAILYDFKVVRSCTNDKPHLEIIRYTAPFERMTRVYK